MSNGMKNDHYYAKVLEMMRQQGSKDNPSTLQLVVMQSADSVKIDDFILNAEDLYIADYLVAGYTQKLKTPYLSDYTLTVKTEQALADASLDVQSGEYVTGVSLEKDTKKYVTSVTPKKTTQPSIIYTEGLKKGDLVAVQKLQNTNKYVILARVVCV
jgi:hypothetical protein